MRTERRKWGNLSQRKGHVFAIAMVAAWMILFAGIFTSQTWAASSTVEIKSPADNATVSLANSKVRAFYNDFEIGDGLAYYKYKESLYPKTVTLKWKSVSERNGKYKIAISTSKTFSKAVKTYYTSKTSYTLSDLYANKTYYWKVKVKSGDEYIDSGVLTFKTKKYPRTVKAKGVSNLRDIGGWYTEDGKRVRQGMVYRSAKLDKISKSGKTKMKSKLRIKTDLDLRRPGEGTAGTKSPLGKSRNYINISAPKYDEVWESKKQRKTLVKEMKVFAKKKNYPIVFHCTYGRDRTGTLAFTLNALLGVSKKDLYRDYELSFLSKQGSKSKKGGNHYLKRFNKLYRYMSTYQGTNKSLTANDPLSEHVEQFLLDNGMKKSEIKKIRQIMLKD